MTRESELNTIIKNSFNLQDRSRLFKIPDPIHGTGIRNPCDLVGIIHGYPAYVESKLIKKEYEAFSLNRVEDHQYENLQWYNKNSQNKIYSLIIVGYYVPRKIKDIFIFDSNFVFEQYSQGVKSFKKKQILEWREKQSFCSINYKEIEGKRLEVISDLENIDTKIIRGF